MSKVDPALIIASILLIFFLLGIIIYIFFSRNRLNQEHIDKQSLFEGTAAESERIMSRLAGQVREGVLTPATMLRDRLKQGLTLTDMTALKELIGSAVGLTDDILTGAE